MKKGKSYRRPAVCFETQLKEEWNKMAYKDEMFYYMGSPGSDELYIAHDSGNIGGTYRYQWAIVDDKEKVIGIVDYAYNARTKVTSQFGLYSFDKGNPIIGYALKECLDEIIYKLKSHRVEWRMVSGNPIQKHYDKYCDMYNGTKHILKDACMDIYGNYHDDIIYELIDPWKVNTQELKINEDSTNDAKISKHNDGYSESLDIVNSYIAVVNNMAKKIRNPRNCIEIPFSAPDSLNKQYIAAIINAIAYSYEHSLNRHHKIKEDGDSPINVAKESAISTIAEFICNTYIANPYIPMEYAENDMQFFVNNSKMAEEVCCKPKVVEAITFLSILDLLDDNFNIEKFNALTNIELLELANCISLCANSQFEDAGDCMLPFITHIANMPETSGILDIKAELHNSQYSVRGSIILKH